LESGVPADLAAELALVAETQERFVWAVPARFSDTLLEIYNRRHGLPAICPGAGARVIGRFEGHGRFVVRRRGEIVVDVPNELITCGIAVPRPARRRGPAPAAAATPPPRVADPLAVLAAWAGSRRGASRRPLLRFYDSEAQGRAVLPAGRA